MRFLFLHCQEECFCAFALLRCFFAAERKLALPRADFAAREGFPALSRFFPPEERMAFAAITPLTVYIRFSYLNLSGNRRQDKVY